MTLAEVLDYRTAHRENRMKAAQWVLANPDCFEDLLNYSLQHGEKIAIKASWVLEFVFLERPELLYPQIDTFCSQIGGATRESAIRPFAHISEVLCVNYYKKFDPKLRSVLNDTHKQQLVECCFDWMIGDHKVACQARAMLCLYYLGNEQEWVHPELVQILKERIHHGSAGYKNRAQKILDKLS
ncbi:adenylosuccinate lyase [Aureitalea marina]|uniref:Adenylosuccinate lyase n=1 Tax=Aureitalea marina TaxID=930804 RepID=A0A2S7KPL3_9FLAO|nr:adenylosuccinate lyase [Aureitalea marina]PQB04569.1 hypothetical protein BST85_06395 [Aureitalea marina]